MKNVIETKELQGFGEAYKPELNYLGDVLFPNEKFDSVQFAWESISGKDLLPVMADVSALDAEAPIRQRPDAKIITAEALLIKHKINLTEHAARIKSHGIGEARIKELIFDDVDNLYRGVLARIEAMKMELLANGQITIKENNINKVVSYDYPSANIFITDLTSAATDVFELVERVKAGARANGKKVSYVVCSSRTIDLLYKNTGLQNAWKNSAIVIMPTKDAFRTFVENVFGIQFIVYDEQYKYEKADGSYVQTLFYPEDRMTFVCGEAGAELGKGAFAPTPEEEMLGEEAVSLDGKAVATLWNEKDPAAQWSKVSAVALPILKDVDNFYIVYTE